MTVFMQMILMMMTMAVMNNEYDCGSEDYHVVLQETGSCSEKDDDVCLCHSRGGPLQFISNFSGVGH